MDVFVATVWNAFFSSKEGGVPEPLSRMSKSLLFGDEFLIGLLSLDYYHWILIDYYYYCCFTYTPHLTNVQTSVCTI